MTIEEKVALITKKLKEEYPTVETPLNHKNAFELLIATVLSAQTLDTTVNKISPKFFEKYPRPELLAQANERDAEKLLLGVNYYRTKAKNVIKLSQMLVTKYNSEVPSTMEELDELPGVGRKTANVILAEWFFKEKGILPVGFVVDTHVKRVAKRLGLTNETEPEKVEQDLMKLFPREEWDSMGLRLIFHGRYMCKARNPECYKDEFWSKMCACVKEVRKL